MKNKHIYTVTNLLTNQIYVGITFDFEKRKKHHFYEAGRNLMNQSKLHSDMNKIGINIYVINV